MNDEFFGVRIDRTDEVGERGGILVCAPVGQLQDAYVASEIRKCLECDASVWVSKAVLARPDASRLLFACLPCALGEWEANGQPESVKLLDTVEAEATDFIAKRAR